MAIIINGTLNIDGVNKTNIKKENPFVSTFNFIFNQEYASAIVTVTSIGGFTSTPSFTPTSNTFTFNSTGSPLGTTTFSYTATTPVTITLTSELIQNDVVIQTLSEQFGIQRTFTFSPIIVGVGDVIQIRTYFAD